MSLRQYARDATKRQKDAFKAIRKARGQPTFTDKLEDFVKNPRETISSYVGNSRKPRYGTSAVDKVQRYVIGAGIATAVIGIPLAAALYFTKPDPTAYQLPAQQQSSVSTQPSEVAIDSPSQQGLEEIIQKDISEVVETTPQTLPYVESVAQEDIVAQESKDYEFETQASEQDVPQTWTTWKPEYSGLELTQDVPFAAGQQLYKTFLDAGVPEEVAIPSVKATAIDNEWYDPDKVVDGELREGENPLVLDSYPRAGETYTLTLDATEFVPEPIESVSELADSFDVSSFEPGLGPYMGSYTPENGTGVLGALREVIGDEELYAQASRFSVVATGIHPKNNLFPEECLTASGSFDYDACPRPVNKIKPWTAGREYTLVVTFPEDFSKENDYGGNFDYKVK